MDNGTCCTRYTGHVGAVNSVDLHPTDNLAISGSGDTECHLWPFDINSQVYGFSVTHCFFGNNYLICFNTVRPLQYFGDHQNTHGTGEGTLSFVFLSNPPSITDFT